MSAGASRPIAHGPSARSVRRLGAIITGLAILALVLTVWMGVAARVGVQDCVVCNGNSCTSTSPCPETIVGLLLTGVFLAIESFFVSLGLSLGAVAKMLGVPVRDPPTALPTGPQLALHLAAPTLMFLGWSLAVLGLILPFGLFQLCHQPCGYPWAPWVLDGVPLLLVNVGAVMLTAGVALLAIVSIQLRRSAHRRPPEPRTVRQGQHGPG